MGRSGGRSPLSIMRLYLLFVGPAALIYVLFVLVPLGQTVLMSLVKWNGVSPNKVFVGLQHYRMLFQDQKFWIALRNNIVWIVASIINPMVVGLILAVLLNTIYRSSKVYLTLFFFPVVLPLVIVGLTWGLMYNPIIGPINMLLKALGLSSIARGWLGDPVWATPAIIIAGNWTFFGFCTVIFLAGLQAIDPSIIEASVMDGAGPITRFLRIIVPGLRDQINLLVVFSIIGSFKVFDIVYVMTQGGPNHASEVIATYMYWQAFNNGRVGYGSALAIALTAAVAVMSLLYLRFRERMN